MMMMKGRNGESGLSLHEISFIREGAELLGNCTVLNIERMHVNMKRSPINILIHDHATHMQNKSVPS